ncbi:MAG TPA: adenosylcobalamin-dependent ribonucleoside-diphosphate reductase [Planctomycetota bacterium]|jgi:ribonucleoside-diphosphate reductase alpha chain|nr:adenosylcobalamin-dependent ribonucleoside-diphosphate reductase [Planctomycetota bacterium]
MGPTRAIRTGARGNGEVAVMPKARASAGRSLLDTLPDPDLRPNGLKVLEARYLKKGPDRKPAETPKELFWRVASTIASAEAGYPGGTPERVEQVAREFYALMASQVFMPNSPTLMNAGREMGMLSACFVVPVEDSIEGIFSAIKATALIQKAGGGTGFSFSRLRPCGDVVHSSGGTTEGPLSFLQVFSAATNAIQQGAFRRGANMGILRIDHPDVVAFIQVKEDLAQLTNYNLSVAVTQKYLDELRRDPKTVHQVQNPRTKAWAPLAKKDGSGSWTVGELWDLICVRAWGTGEPGLFFIDRANEANPIRHLGLIEATNPCGEQDLHPWDSCNLGSVNLGKFVGGGAEGPSFDWEGLRRVLHSCTRFLDDVIDVNRYPLPEIDRTSKTTRRIGLGVMGFADALFKLGIPYDSEEGCAFGESLMKFFTEEAHRASEALAGERGPFPAWEGSDWEKRGRKMRNSYCTTVAPTGTISIIANCSGGIEPLFSIAFWRQVLDGQRMIEVNEPFVEVARRRGFHSEALLEKAAESGSIRHLEGIPEDVQRVFVCAHDVEPQWHVRMQAAFQKHTDAQVSKTINLSHGAEVADVKRVYEMAIDLGLRGITVYRDGCRDRQPMALTRSLRRREEVAPPERRPDATAEAAAAASPLIPVRLPAIMPSLRVRQITPFGNMHVKISVDPKAGIEREVFSQLGKGGDIANSDLEAICRLLSLFLRCGGSIELAIKQLEGIGSSLTVPSREGRIMSLADGLAKGLRRYLRAKEKFGLKSLLLGEVDPDALASATEGGNGSRSGDPSAFKVKCPECEGVLAFEEGCVKCPSCGFSQC